MACATSQNGLGSAMIAPELLQAIVPAVSDGLGMCGAKANCVGVCKVPVGEFGTVTGVIGIHGQISGYATVNMPEKVALALVNGLAGEQFSAITYEVIDGVGELTNIIVGGIKTRLAGTDWALDHVTVPSVIVGQHYQIAYMRGFDFVTVLFEHEDPTAVVLQDRIFQISLSLLRVKRS